MDQNSVYVVRYLCILQLSVCWSIGIKKIFLLFNEIYLTALEKSVWILMSSLYVGVSQIPT